MPKILKLPPLDLGHETIGRRLARVRKECGVTQLELADKLGITKSLIQRSATPGSLRWGPGIPANLSGGPLDHPSRRRDNLRRLPGRAECRQELAGAQLRQSNPQDAEFVVNLERLRRGFSEQAIPRQKGGKFRLHGRTHQTAVAERVPAAGYAESAAMPSSLSSATSCTGMLASSSHMPGINQL